MGWPGGPKLTAPHRKLVPVQGKFLHQSRNCPQHACVFTSLATTHNTYGIARLGRGRVLSWTSVNQFATVGDVLGRYHNLHLQQNHMPPKKSLFDQYPRRESSIKVTNTPQRMRPLKIWFLILVLNRI